jgi:hypothetical protein
MIIQGVTQSFLRDLLKGRHDFTTHTFKVALYSSSADLSSLTTDYTTTGEVTGTGYTAGGVALTPTLAVSDGVYYVDFADVTFSSVTLTARGALIYNTTTAGGTGTTDAVYVINFGLDITRTGTDLVLRFPSPTPLEALLRLSA